MIAKAGGHDPRGNRDPVCFHDYHPSKALTKRLTNAADMSGADSERDVVMMSGNWYCDVSNDGGATWKRLDPTTIFPETLGGGFCCDQMVVYVPSIDRFIWFLQYATDAAGQGAFRIAVGLVGIGQERPDGLDVLGLRRRRLRLRDERHGLPGPRLLVARSSTSSTDVFERERPAGRSASR